MEKSKSTPCTCYFEELTCILAGEGFEPQPLEDDILPVHYGGELLCSATENGIRYFPANISSTEKEKGRDRVADTVARVKEYMTLMEAALFLKATGLDEQYKLLADFNGVVLAGRSGARNGVQFVTWDWDYDRKGVNHGHYAGNDYNAAKQDFAVRCGLVDKHRLFSDQQLTTIHQSCSILEDEVILSDEQYKTLDSIRDQIECVLPDATEQSAAQEQTRQMNM